MRDEETCDCVDCQEGDPCHCDCDPDEACSGCMVAAAAAKDREFDERQALGCL